MNNLIEKGIISCLDGSSCFSYVLSDNSHFITTEYKVLQGQTSSFVKCMKMLYNGKTMLCYIPGVLRPLSSLLTQLDGGRFMKIAANLLADIREVNSNGFLTSCNLDLSFDRIYVNPANGAVSLVYLPLSRKNYEDYYALEAALKTALAEAIAQNANLQDSATARFAECLNDSMHGVDSLLMLIGGGQKPGVPEKNARPGANAPRGQARCAVVAVNAPMELTIEVTKDDFVLGKHPKMVDGVIPFNNMISRRHAMIIYRNNAYYIIDLASSNHTYVNRKLLPPDTPCKLENGTMVRLANSDFRIEIST